MAFFRHLPCRCPRRRTAFDNLDHSNSQIIRISHRQPPRPEKAHRISFAAHCESLRFTKSGNRL